MLVRGKVINGSGRGKKLGFPTANLDIPANMEEGIYLGEAGGQPALVFVGAAKTFGEKDKKVEVHILDFEDDLYGREMEVRTIKKIRENQRFQSEEELVEQMKKDEAVAREYFKTGTPLE